MSMLLKQWTVGMASGTNWSSYWTPQYQAVLDEMTTEPSNDDKLIQAKWLKQMIDGGYFAKAELLDLFATHTGGSLINWKSPGTFDPSLVNAPSFTAYAGYTGSSVGTKCGRTNFIPATHQTIMSTNSATVMIGVGNDVNEGNVDFGGSTSGVAHVYLRSNSGNNYRSGLNNNALSADIAGGAGCGIAHFALSKNEEFKWNVYRNSTKNIITTAAAANSLPVELYFCGRNDGGSITASNRQLRYLFVFSFLSDVEIAAVQGLMEEYLDSYGTGLI